MTAEPTLPRLGIAVMLAVAFIVPAHAGHRHPMTIGEVIAGCSIDARRPPTVLTCLGGCVIMIPNGVGGAGALPQANAACRALR